MRRIAILSLLALAAVTAMPREGRSEVIVRAPFVSIHVGPPAVPGTPAVGVFVPGIVDVRVRKASRIYYPPAPPPMPAPSPSAPPPVFDPTTDEPPPPPTPVRPKSAIPAAPPGIEEMPAPRLGVPAVVQPMRHYEFTKVFKPAPGIYEVLLIHPGTKHPVKVKFELPNEHLKKVHVHPRQFEYDYGKHFVRVRFTIGGGVRVTMK